DYSQIELRVMAHLSGDENMINVFREGKDLHAATAATIYKKGMHPIHLHCMHTSCRRPLLIILSLIPFSFLIIYVANTLLYLFIP
ncbi:MAG: hypothetical protein II044_04630, partial [Lachnospiraceae bacterium]|nr:hypothetical protein [Lachnospiraceae bacterium]